MTHVYFDSDQIDWNPYIHTEQIGQGAMMGGEQSWTKIGEKYSLDKNLCEAMELVVAEQYYRQLAVSYCQLQKT